ncbi:arm repeat superfamily protein [Trifolium pratense]|uniref:Arm repeat superfamily protein n=1 Tax=Trifolium pratense TaxID=57577 RepID=A0A2K3PQY4_TRIPR|nr:arm repeat superfamily protein [Trifolium pratense]
MSRNLSPVLRRELENLDKDADSRKSAMRALKSYVKDMDVKAIPTFLAQVSETKETGTVSGEFTISLYEVLARVHGVKIVPMIDSIMQSIIQTLASSAGSFPLQQACSKVVPAVARYGIDPTMPEDKKKKIIHSICKPLSDSLTSSQECLSCGAALCLTSLVDSDNWRFASDEMVNRVCQNVAVALEGKSSQTNLHMGLVMSLAKHNSLIVEAYARLLIQSGLRMVKVGGELLDGNSQKRFAAIQMVNYLMKCLDPRSIFSEIEQVIEEMEQCQSDKMAFIKGAALEALQTAKKVASDKKVRRVKSPVSVTGSNFSRPDYMEGDSSSGDGDQTPTSNSPESRTLDYFPGYGSLAESPLSTYQSSHNMNYSRRSVNRKLWSRENGGVDVSLKDGLFSSADERNGFLENTLVHKFSNGDGELTEEFAGFIQRNPSGRVISKSTNTSPLRSRTHFDSIQIFDTPKRLIRSLQDPSDDSSVCSEKPIRRFRSLSSGHIDWSPSAYSKYDQNGISNHVKYHTGENASSCGDVQYQDGSESVSSTDDLLGDANTQRPSKEIPESNKVPQIVRMEKPLQKTKRRFVCGLSFVILAMATPLIWINSQEEAHFLVPT